MNYESQYINALKDIYENGFSDGTNERTGLSTKRLPGIVIRVDLGKEFPILKSKKLFHKSAEQEILWIWQKMSNNIQDLKPHIWDAWADKYGSIGKAYGFQIAKPVDINVGNKDKKDYRHYDNQTDFILSYLKEFPHGRWAKGTLWNPAELRDMHLCPCVHGTDWNLDGGRLNVVVHQRSGDMPYGVPFNTTQYAMLTHMFARHLGVEPGILTHVIADAHIYDNQMEGVKQQLAYYSLLDHQFTSLESDTINFDDLSHIDQYIKKYHITQTVEEIYEQIKLIKKSIPQFVIDKDITSFWDMNENNARVENYCSMPKIDFGDVAV